MTAYPSALQALRLLLAKCGETHWRDWLDQDLAEWEKSRSVSHHLSAHGGMGSFNDVYLSASQCGLAEDKQPWVVALFQDLKSVCYLLSGYQKGLFRGLETWRLKRDLGHRVDVLQGWKCESCGYAEVTTRDVELYLARKEMRREILQSISEQRLLALVEDVLSGERIRLAEGHRKNLEDRVRASGLEIRVRDGWMRPCPKCGSDNTSVYYWELDEETGIFSEARAGRAVMSTLS